MNKKKIVPFIVAMSLMVPLVSCGKNTGANTNINKLHAMSRCITDCNCNCEGCVCSGNNIKIETESESDDALTIEALSARGFS